MVVFLFHRTLYVCAKLHWNWCVLIDLLARGQLGFLVCSADLERFMQPETFCVSTCCVHGVNMTAAVVQCMHDCLPPLLAPTAWLPPQTPHNCFPPYLPPRSADAGFTLRRCREAAQLCGKQQQRKTEEGQGRNQCYCHSYMWGCTVHLTKKSRWIFHCTHVK